MRLPTTPPPLFARLRVALLVVAGLALPSAGCNRRAGAAADRVRLAPKRSAAQLATDLAAAAYQPVAEELRGEITVSGPNLGRVKLNAIVRVRPDTAVWFTLRKFGIEGARGIVTRDSAIVLNRLEREVLRASAGDLPAAARILPVDVTLATLVAALYGAPVVPVAGGDVTRLPGGYRVEVPDTHSTLTLAAAPSRIEAWTYREGAHYGRAEYGNFRAGPGGKELPYTRTFTASDSPGDTTRVTFAIASVTTPDDLRFPLSVPADYAPMSF